MTGKKLTENCYWFGKIIDIVEREKSWNILLHKRSFNGTTQKIYINFQNNVQSRFFQVGDIVEINGIIQVDFDKQTSCRWGNNMKVVWSDRQTTYTPEPKAEAQQETQPEPKKEMDFEFDSILEELESEVKKL